MKSKILLLMTCLIVNYNMHSQTDAFIGQISIMSGNTVPSGWLLCNGQSLSKTSYSLLYYVIGDTYGSTETTFNLPNLCGKVPVGAGTLDSITYTVGATGGSNTTTLTIDNLPTHFHYINIPSYSGYGNTSSPVNNIFANTKILDKEYSTNPPDTYMKPFLSDPVGSGTPYTNMQPYIVMKYIICYNGIFPTPAAE